MITTKWPRLLVVGAPVTPEQADEILIRTTNWEWISTNDRQWEATIERAAAEVSGRPREVFAGADGSAERIESIHARYDAIKQWRQRMGVLDLGYLGNCRVASSWIGGPKGWCDWDGRIGCDSYNIGKWPSDDEVTSDWQAIAEAFPYLELTAQCVEEEGAGALAAEWRVRSGTVDYNPSPTEPITAPTELDESQILGRIVFGQLGAERGCTEARLRSALERVTNHQAAKENS